MFAVLKFIYILYRAFKDGLNPNINSLRHAPVYLRYLTSILLACFWCLAFGVYFGDIQNIGYNMLGHAAVISMAFVTWAVFKQVNRIYGPREGTQEWLRMPDRSSRCDEMTDEQRIEKAKEFKN